MTRLLEEAFQLARALPEPEQETLATRILAELNDECRWGEAFSNSQDLLAELAAEARAEYRFGRTLPLSVAERIQIAGDLWDSVTAEPPARFDGQPVGEVQREIVLRRSAAYRDDPGAAVPLDEVLERIERNLE